MKLILPGLLLLSFFITGAGQQQDCKSFHNGKFRYLSDKLSDIIIERNDTLQIERDTHSGYNVIAKVKWLSDCQYKLTYKTTTDPSLKKLIGVTILTKIVRTSGDTIVCRSASSGKSAEIKILKIR